MIYDELIKSIISEIRNKTELKAEPSIINTLLEYFEAFEECYDDIPEDSPFNSQLTEFLVEITAKYKNKSLIELKAQHNFFIVGSVYAMLGKCYDRGLFGIERNLNQAIEHYMRSAICKNPMGTYELARCYEQGKGTNQDLEQACILYRVSYKLGYIKALHKYALILIRGNPFVERNILDGYYILKQAVMTQNRIYIAPYYDLGMLYQSKLCDMLDDKYYAFEIFKIGARKGCKFCQYKVGEEYERGEIIERDLTKAFYWYRISANNRLSESQFKVAEILYGIKKSTDDINKMIEDEGLNEGQIVFQGGSKMHNLTEFDKMYNLTEFDMAILRIKPLINFEEYYGPDIDRFKEGFRMARLSAASGNKGAILLVAEALEKGYGIEKSLLESLWWYKIAESLGVEDIREKIHLLEMKIASHYERITELKFR